MKTQKVATIQNCNNYQTGIKILKTFLILFAIIMIMICAICLIQYMKVNGEEIDLITQQLQPIKTGLDIYA